MSWFPKVTFEEPTDGEHEVDYPHLDSGYDQWEIPAERSDSSAAQPRLGDPVRSQQSVTQDEELSTRSQQYHLRLNHQPSQRLRDFV
ncbi:hypothetical protein NDU88_001763 [Pleurodeles waltl]|uniref:Uncharacterized protein n=1 Tax=Pleurodeles waltl TaxID=8319 RepID=A0AAV7UBB5_PLEWA|nr:hypothetical protein NDU88_001763 [Pleurodeles waltl]